MKKKRINIKVRVSRLKNRVWAECKRIIRKRYPNICYTCGKPNLEGKEWQTGHFIREKQLPLQLKYDLRLLRPQCTKCNLYYKGMESIYALELLRNEGPEYLLDLYDEYRMFKEEKLYNPEQEIFLQAQLDRYKQL